MIISDGIHVTSTTSLEELHAWAQRNGIKRSRYHGFKKGHPHYDWYFPRRKTIYFFAIPEAEYRETSAILQAAKNLVGK